MSNVLAPVMVAALLGPGARAATAPSQTDACARLTQLVLPQAKVASAGTVAAGEFKPPADTTPWLIGEPSLYKTMPPFCRVVVEATPSADSAIAIEVWMPVDGWNGRFRGQGNGGFAGELHFRALGSAVRQGYATAATNTGHSGTDTDASWALGHPEKVTDFGFRAIHTMTEVAKAAIKAFYGRGPQHSYFASCSNGGRQALMEAQRFPGDYNGIVAGAPAHHWTHLLTKALADAQATTLDPAAYIPPGKLPAIAKAVNRACDAGDGVSDGVVGDPSRCLFDPGALLCKEGDSEACLTTPQVKALQALYAGPRDSRGQRIFPGYVPGAEEGDGGWGPWITGTAPGKSLMFAFALGYFSNMVYEKADWDYRAANVEQALVAAEEKTARKLDAADPNLADFKARGGKLILYHGWNDAAISATSTIEYYDSVVGRLGRAETDAFLRLYMVPGMQHCDGGPGPNSFGQHGAAPAREPQRDVFTALEQWVEKGTPPSEIVATKYVDDDLAKGVKISRPLCPHPLIAKYRGQGSPNEATSFVCAPPGG
jgi:Tannase and feruloyl esterase